MDIERLGKYEIIKAIGKGAAGTVWRARDPVIDRIVAIKTVKLEHHDAEHAEEVARFKREAQAAGRLSHPNIVAVYDYGEQGELAYIVMEHVDGGSLKNRLDAGERLPLPQVARVMDELLAALAHAHEKGVVHRDIKPANMMLTQAGQVKVADFGIARIESSTMTQAGTVLGTPAYMSPEQFRGDPVDARTDLYSAGVVLYQLLTGDKPFEGNLTAIMHKVLNVEPPKPSEIAGSVPAAFDTVVRKAMAKRPAERYQSAAAFREAIASAMTEGEAGDPLLGLLGGSDAEATVVARPAAGPVTPPKATAAPAQAPAPRKGMPIGLIAGGAGAVVVAGVAAFLLLGRGEEPPAPAPVPSPPAATVQPAPTPPPVALAPPPRVSEPAQQAAPVPPAAAPSQAATQVPSQAPSQPASPFSTAPAPLVLPPTLSPAPAPASPAPIPSTPPPPAVAQAPPQPAAPPPVAQTQTQTQAPTPPPAAQPPPPRPTPPPVTQAPVPLPVPATPAPEPPRAQPQPPAAAAPTPPPAPVTLPPVVTAPPAAPSVPARPPEPPPAPAPPQQVAAAPVAGALRSAIAGVLSEARCALIGGDMEGPNRARLTGYAQAGGGEAALRLRLASAGVPPGAIDWGVRGFEGPYCQALDLLRPHADGFATPPSGLGLALAGGVTRLVKDDLLTVNLTLPGFPSYLRVSYFMHDGEVFHLHPTPTDPPRAFGPGVRITLGDPASGGAKWEIGPPYGTEMIVAVASERPLFAAARPELEQSDDYLAALAAALRSGAAGRVAARVLMVDVAER
jgi:serine/threonine-protein kinase